MLPLTTEELKSHQDARKCYIAKEESLPLEIIAIKVVNIEAK